MDQVRAGSEEAAWQLIGQYAGHVLRVVRRRLHQNVRSKFDSSDFVQAVWLSFFESRSEIAEFESPEQLIAFLARLALNKVAAETRRRLMLQKHNVGREREMWFAGGDNWVLNGREPTPSEVLIAQERWERLVSDQPEHYRQVLRLRYLGSTQKEIAEQLGIDERTVRKILEKLLLMHRDIKQLMHPDL